MANNETRILKTNTFEEWRQKDNEISLELGDVDQLDSRILDKTFTYTASADDSIFTGNDTTSKALRFEQKVDEALDLLNIIIFTGVSSIPSNFVVGNTVTQSGGFSGKLVWINKNKVALSNTSGTFNAGQNLVQGSQNIPHANLVRLISESVKVGLAKVKVQGTEITQGNVQAGYHVPNFKFKVVLTGAPTIPAEFSEGVVLKQTASGHQNFVGTLLSADSSTLRFKTHSGTFVTSIALHVDGDTTKRILGSGLASIEVQDETFENIIELHTLAGASHSVHVISNSSVDAINEVQDDVGDITSLGTNNKADIVSSINELETGLRGTRSGLVSAELTTTANDLVSAINEHDAELGTISASAFGTSASTVSTAIAELEQEIDVLNARVEPTQAFDSRFSSSTIMDGINELQGDIGTVGNLTTSATAVVTAINELDLKQGSATLTTNATTLSGGLNELEVGIRGTSNDLVATSLSGMSANNLVSGLLEHETDIGNMSLDTSASNITAAINELHGEINSNDTDIAARLIKVSGSSQALATDLTLGGNKTYTVESGSTLAIASGATLSIAGSSSNVSTFGTSFLEVDGNQTSTGMGLQIARDHIGSAPTPYPALQWRESQVTASKGHRAWQIVGLTANGSSSLTSDLVTFANAEELFTNNTETGLGFVWDSTNQNFDVTLDNSTFALTGDVTGTATQTAKGNVSIATTIAANSVALGTDTTGNYMSGISGTSNEITVSHTPGEGSSATISLPDDVTIGNNLVVTDYTRTAGLRVGTTGADPGDGNLAIAGNATIAGNTTITGNLTVNGTQTSLNVATLEVEDTLILAGSNLGSTEPNSGGFGLETKPFAGVHANAASGVTGAHSIVYNFATDRWEADGSLILSQATAGAPNVEGAAFEDNDNLNFVAGSGLTLVTGKSGTTHTVTYTNSDKGSDQFIFRNVAVAGQTTIVADSNDGHLTVAGGTAITATTNATTDTLTLTHSNITRTDTAATDDGTYVKGITTNAQGHITAVDAGDFDDYYYKQSEFASANTVSKPVIRDGSGNFSAGTISAALTGTASNANKLDDLDSTQFLRSDTADTLGAVLTVGTGGRIDMDVQDAIVAGDYGHGMYGLYNATKFQHVWGMGTAYDMDSSGANITGYYGLAYTHSNNQTDDASGRSANDAETWGGSHQLLNVINGSVTGAIGSNIWTSGQVYTTSYGKSSQWNSAYTDTNNATNANTASRIVKRDANGDFSARIITASLSGSSSSCTGTAANATKLQVNDSESNSNYGFLGAAGTGSRDIYMDIGNLHFNPHTNTITASSFAGTATNVTMNHSDSNANYALVWRSGNTAYYTDEVYVNPHTNVITATQFNGALSGNASTATSAGSITSQANSATITATTAGTASRIALRDTSGDITTRLFRSTYATTQALPSTGFLMGQVNQGADNYLRPHTKAQVLAFLGVAAGANNYSLPTYPANMNQYVRTTDNVHFEGLMVGQTSGSTANTIRCTGDVVAYYSSDKRLKDNIKPIENSLDKVNKLTGYEFDWNDKQEVYEGHDIGVIAQEVEEVAPEIVETREHDGYKAVKYEKLTALLINAVNELTEQNKELKSEIENLKKGNS